MAEPLKGIGVSPGVAVGPAYLLETANRDLADLIPGEDEHRALDDSMNRAAAQLGDLASQLRERGHTEEAGILEAQALMARDPAVLRLAHERVAARQPATQAIQETAAHFKAALEGLGDSYMAGRAADIQDVADRVCRNLQGETPSLALDRPSILVAHDLTPSETASLDRDLVLAIVVDAGSPTSHTAILARALGIPAVVALGDITRHVRDGQELAVDGESGTVRIEPDARDREVHLTRRTTWEARRRRLQTLRHEPAETRDGHRLTLAANIGSPDDLPAALDAGAEGIGLYRTEFLFASRESMPDEEEQVRAYRAALEAMPDHTVVIRTLDVGGDKPLPYLPAPHEANPFLGQRGIRYTFAHPEVLRAQLRALLRASHHGKLAVMFPMISESAQVERARELVEESRNEVGGEVEVGIMIEVPAAALIADRLAARVAFFSVGTNDLIQYTLAADRVNDRVAALYQPFHPAVLRLLAATVDGAHAQGRWAGVCGEMAGDPLAVPILVGLGFDELSMSPGSIPAARERVRSLTFQACRNLSADALGCETPEEVTRLILESVGDAL